MAPWFISGAGGSGVGAKTLELALAEHHPVIAVIRNPQVATGLQEKGVQIFIGDACDSQITTCTCRAAGQHATVISSMGGAQDYLAYKTVINETEKTETKHMILVASPDCDDSWPFSSPCVRAAFDQVVREKSLTEGWLQTNLLDYAIFRPGGLLDGETTGLAQRIQVEECHGLMMRTDATWHVYELTTAPVLNNQIYSLVEPGLKPA